MTRKVKLPGVAKRALPLTDGERVLAAALLADRPVGDPGSYLVATDRAMYWPLNGSGHERTAWDRMAGASWQDETSTLVFARTDQPPMPFAVEDPGLLPETVRERVTASIVVSRHVALRGRQGVRITARRQADGPAMAEADQLVAELRWELIYDDGVDQTDQAIRDAANTALTAIKHEVG
jgi:hypothetical protein